ncbi:hypothetical protein WSM22_45830 [Cytophagales bacterium WSM2-2]|nr:hypothetical protein WSM22_45830 [Cytophagales bacterium WSM2-2]
MKFKELFFLMIILCISAVIIFSSHHTPDEKRVIENNKSGATDFINSNSDYSKDISNYKREASKKISVNSKKLSSFISRIKANNEGVTTIFYQSKLLKLKDRNNILKRRIGSYKGEGKVKWVSFKKEFGHEMKELSKSLDDLPDNISNQ